MEMSIRVNCGSNENYTDKAGREWLADQSMVGGENTWGAVDGVPNGHDEPEISGTDNSNVYLTERYGVSEYVFTVPVGNYTVRLHFAETYEGNAADGKRVFNVSINNKVVLPNMDPYKEAKGVFKPIVKEFKGIEISDGKMVGKLVIGFEKNIQSPQINGIEVIKEESE